LFDCDHAALTSGISPTQVTVSDVMANTPGRCPAAAARKSDYEEDDIINFLTVNYDNVRVLSEKEFNEYTEDDIFYNED
jgi:hypothetical protein